jgi:ABC-type lipoprotein export system ATPase subunit
MTDGPDLKSTKAHLRRGFLVAEVTIEKLFGQYTYRISPLSVADAKRGAPQLMLLYGENGSGKTTVLRLLWHLLSPSDDRRHRSSLAEIPFSQATVRLGNGDMISVQKKTGLVGDYSIAVNRGKTDLVTQDYTYDPADRSVRPSQQGILSTTGTITVNAGNSVIFDTNALNVLNTPFNMWEPEDKYIRYLANLEATPFFMGDDRQLHSDQIDEDTRARYRISASRHSDDDTRSSVAAMELSNAIAEASNQLRQLLLTGTATGLQNIDQVYLEVLAQLAKSEETVQSADSIRHSLTNLAERSRDFYEFRIMPRVPASAFIKLIDQMDEARQDLAFRVLEPYIDGQNARIKSLHDAERLIRTFVVNIQKYLGSRKTVTFTPADGLVILGQNNARLTSEQLSSGERQLLLLLCNSLLARKSSSLFLIDEPELSLNSGWQRELVGSLLEIVAGANVQFIMATHSIQIISRYNEYLTELKPVSE